jgi:hypothetical protein
MLVQKREFRSGLLRWAETARIHFFRRALLALVSRPISRRALSQRRDTAVRSRNQLAKAAFSAGTDAA